MLSIMKNQQECLMLDWIASYQNTCFSSYNNNNSVVANLATDDYLELCCFNVSTSDSYIIRSTGFYQALLNTTYPLYPTSTFNNQLPTFYAFRID